MNEQRPSKKKVDDSIPAVLRRRLKELRNDGYNFEFCNVFERAAKALERPAHEPCERHERRVVAHVSGWQEQMDTCACGEKWPCARAAQPPPAECAGCEEFVRMQHDIASLLGVDSDTDSIGLHELIYGELTRRAAQPPSAQMNEQRPSKERDIEQMIVYYDHGCDVDSGITAAISREDAPILVEALRALKRERASHEPPAVPLETLQDIAFEHRSSKKFHNGVLALRAALGSRPTKEAKP